MANLFFITIHVIVYNDSVLPCLFTQQSNFFILACNNYLLQTVLFIIIKRKILNLFSLLSLWRDYTLSLLIVRYHMDIKNQS